MKSVVILVAPLLAGCALSQQTRNVELIGESNIALAACLREYPVTRETVMERMKCVNQAFLIRLPSFGPNKDLAYNLTTHGTVIAEQYKNGRITQAQFNAAIADEVSRLNSELLRRKALWAAAVAGRSAADAATIAATRPQRMPKRVQHPPPAPQSKPNLKI
jgi:hypothetical protein